MNPEALYSALVADAEIDSLNWDLAGRQASIWKKYGTWVLMGILIVS